MIPKNQTILNNHANDQIDHPSNTSSIKYIKLSFFIDIRSFEQIIAEERQRRDILDIHIQKINSIDENGEIVRPKSLTYEDLAELLFDELKIEPEECSDMNLNAGKYDQREIIFKWCQHYFLSLLFKGTLPSYRINSVCKY